MTTIQTPPPPASAERLLGVVRWLLPLGLAVLAAIIEWGEHIASSEDDVTLAFAGEVLLFAVVGPVAVAVTLRWVSRVLAGYRATASALETMNRSLEAMVADRTRHLATATAQLAAANDDLRQLDRMKSEFVSLVSHQLRAPLTNMNGALEIVSQDADLLPASSRRTLQILTLESQRLSRLIQTILDVSRIEAGKLTLRLGAVAMEPLLARSCASTRESDPERPVVLTMPAALPPAWADETLVEEVVRNLLENAIRYSRAETPIDVVARLDGGSISVTVTDHGPGVPPDDQEQIFRSFHRLGDSETAAKGYGLGLYFADKLIVALGGTITVESPVWPDPDEPGARFRFTLPIAAAEPDDGDPPDAAAEPDAAEPDVQRATTGSPSAGDTPRAD